jgi:hypothetical protein
MFLIQKIFANKFAPTLVIRRPVTQPQRQRQENRGNGQAGQHMG